MNWDQVEGKWKQIKGQVEEAERQADEFIKSIKATTDDTVAYGDKERARRAGHN